MRRLTERTVQYLGRNGRNGGHGNDGRNGRKGRNGGHGKDGRNGGNGNISMFVFSVSIVRISSFSVSMSRFGPMGIGIFQFQSEVDFMFQSTLECRVAFHPRSPSFALFRPLDASLDR